MKAVPAHKKKKAIAFSLDDETIKIMNELAQDLDINRSIIVTKLLKNFYNTRRQIEEQKKLFSAQQGLIHDDMYRLDDADFLEFEQ